MLYCLGGEPTCDENFEYMVNTLYANGFIIGIHTNGSNPHILQKVFDKISFFGVDIKTSKCKYNESTGIVVDTSKIEQTIDMILKSGKDYEFRTTLFPKHVSKEDTLEIASWLKSKGVKSYHLQQYYPVGSAEMVDKYSQEMLQQVQKSCNEIIPTILKTK